MIISGIKNKKNGRIKFFLFKEEIIAIFLQFRFIILILAFFE